jgi:hypothetical protein
LEFDAILMRFEVKMNENKVEKEHLIPQNGSVEMKKKHDNSFEWVLYSRRITKNPYMKKHLFKKVVGQCFWCSKQILNDFTIHHIDYDHKCEFGKFIEVDRPTEKRPNKIATVPDCETCFSVNQQCFDKCADRLFAIHRICNKLINDKYESKNINNSKLKI